MIRSGAIRNQTQPKVNGAAQLVPPSPPPAWHSGSSTSMGQVGSPVAGDAENDRDGTEDEADGATGGRGSAHSRPSVNVMARIVDTRGLMSQVIVTPADPSDRDGAKAALFRLRLTHPEIAVVWADGAYASILVIWAKKYLTLTIPTVAKCGAVVDLVTRHPRPPPDLRQPGDSVSPWSPGSWSDRPDGRAW